MKPVFLIAFVVLCLAMISSLPSGSALGTAPLPSVESSAAVSTTGQTVTTPLLVAEASSSPTVDQNVSVYVVVETNAMTVPSDTPVVTDSLSTGQHASYSEPFTDTAAGVELDLFEADLVIASQGPVTDSVTLSLPTADQMNVIVAIVEATSGAEAISAPVVQMSSSSVTDPVSTPSADDLVFQILAAPTSDVFAPQAGESSVASEPGSGGNPMSLAVQSSPSTASSATPTSSAAGSGSVVSFALAAAPAGAVKVTTTNTLGWVMVAIGVFFLFVVPSLLFFYARGFLVGAPGALVSIFLFGAGVFFIVSGLISLGV